MIRWECRYLFQIQVRIFMRCDWLTDTRGIRSKCGVGAPHDNSQDLVLVYDEVWIKCVVYSYRYMDWEGRRGRNGLKWVGNSRGLWAYRTATTTILQVRQRSVWFTGIPWYCFSRHPSHPDEDVYRYRYHAACLYHTVLETYCTVSYVHFRNSNIHGTLWN